MPDFNTSRCRLEVWEEAWSGCWRKLWGLCRGALAVDLAESEARGAFALNLQPYFATLQCAFVRRKHAATCDNSCRDVAGHLTAHKLYVGVLGSVAPEIGATNHASLCADPAARAKHCHARHSPPSDLAALQLQPAGCLLVKVITVGSLYITRSSCRHASSRELMLALNIVTLCLKPMIILSRSIVLCLFVLPLVWHSCHVTSTVMCAYASIMFLLPLLLVVLLLLLLLRGSVLYCTPA
mmetsp:Transcript_14531/g.39321  ORF Transcript_14531/g.39321 Transcript_14531/m.39321 type:complete len:239 (-) Transcript_14531:761-1477(-)